jgi:hypothetical protein
MFIVSLTILLLTPIDIQKKKLNSSSGNRGVQFTDFNNVNEDLNAPVEIKGSFSFFNILCSDSVNKMLRFLEMTATCTPLFPVQLFSHKLIN